MLPALPDPELFFGFCAPVGTDNKKVYDLLSNCLRKYHYNAEYFKVTELMKGVRPKGAVLQDSPLECRYDSYITYANKIRETLSLMYALAMLCCLAVRNYRRGKLGNPDTYVPRTAYVFDQFKRKEEIDLLRQVYGRLFVVISIYSEKANRTNQLVSKIASDHADARHVETHVQIANDLMNRDQKEEKETFGQRLEEAFPSADLFINIDDLDSAERLLIRFLDALFGSNSVSPTRDEYGMYLARNASLRSIDLSRQVGAAIFTGEGEVITVGCNEVPKAFGGTYWTGDEGDARDMQKGFDSNERIKRSLLVDFAKRLSDLGVLSDKFKDDDVAKLILKETSRGGALRDVQLMDLLEFGRMIHAEMSAICDAARLGKTVRQGILFTTTFPCHLCAKHIVAAGIKRVVYIEPFPKSYAEQLHKDAITVGRSNETKKVIFEPFIGISPYRYRDLFARDKRKNDGGDFQAWMDGTARPIIKYTVAAYVQNEAAAAKMFSETVVAKAKAGLIELLPTPHLGDFDKSETTAPEWLRHN